MHMQDRRKAGSTRSPEPSPAKGHTGPVHMKLITYMITIYPNINHNTLIRHDVS